MTDRSTVLIRSGTTEVSLLALMVSAAVMGRSDVEVWVYAGNVEIESSVMVNCDPDAAIPEYYQITTPSTLNMTNGTAFNLQFTTAGGGEGPVTWIVGNPAFLANHGMRFTNDGVLKSDGNVLGPAEQRSLMFVAKKETGLQTRMYASKIINLIIA